MNRSRSFLKKSTSIIFHKWWSNSHLHNQTIATPPNKKRLIGFKQLRNTLSRWIATALKTPKLKSWRRKISNLRINFLRKISILLIQITPTTEAAAIAKAVLLKATRTDLPKGNSHRPRIILILTMPITFLITVRQIPIHSKRLNFSRRIFQN